MFYFQIFQNKNLCGQNRKNKISYSKFLYWIHQSSIICFFKIQNENNHWWWKVIENSATIDKKITIAKGNSFVESFLKNILPPWKL